MVGHVHVGGRHLEPLRGGRREESDESFQLIKKLAPDLGHAAVTKAKKSVMMLDMHDHRDEAHSSHK